MESRAPKGGHGGFQPQDAYPSFPLPPAPLAGAGGGSLPGKGGTAAAQRSVGRSSGCNRSGRTWPVSALARGNARESGAAAAGGRLLSFGIINRAVTPDTRGALLLGRKEGVGQQDTQRPGRGGGASLLSRAGVQEELWGTALAWCPRTQRAQPAGRRAPAPGGVGSGGGGGLERRPGAVPAGRADPARGTHLAGARPAARLLHAGGEHAAAAPRAPRLAPTGRVWSFRGTLAGSLSLLEPSLPRHVPRPAGAWVLAPLPR